VAALVLLIGSDVISAEGLPMSITAPEPVPTIAPTQRSHLLLAWTPTGSGGLPLSVARSLRGSEHVSDVAWIYSGLDWMKRSTTASGVVDQPAGDLEVPLEMGAVVPKDYARFVAPSEAATILSLGPHEAVMAQSEARIRGASTGLTLHLDSGTYRVVGIVSDAAAAGYELLVRAPAPDTWPVVDRALLLHLREANARRAVSAEIRRHLTPGQVLRVRSKGETPFLRYGDAVMPQLMIKKYFGEFAAASNGDGTVTIDRNWVSHNIVTARVPFLGNVTCHRAVLPQLRSAFRDIRDSGYGFLIDPSEYGGCYGARFINGVPGTRLSHHAWGIAIDLNVAENAFGARPTQDPKIVTAMEDEGFTWGGRWLVPDGMHFEWVRFP
jgi:hypothetical protein